VSFVNSIQIDHTVLLFRQRSSLHNEVSMSKTLPRLVILPFWVTESHKF